METDQRHLLTVSLLVSPSVELGLEGTTSSLVFCIKIVCRNFNCSYRNKVRIKTSKHRGEKDKKEGLTGEHESMFETWQIIILHVFKKITRKNKTKKQRFTNCPPPPSSMCFCRLYI